MSAIDFEITDEMVEIAAAASYEHVERSPWADAHPDDQDVWRYDARAGLEAVGHLIAAAAVRKTSARLQREVWSGPKARAFLDRTATDYEAGVTPNA